MLSIMVRRFGWGLLVALAAVAMVVALSPAAGAQTPANDPAAIGARTITVVGEGKASVEPDLARANIGVEVARTSVQEASAENRALLEAVLAALRDQGIAEEDIQTSGFSVYADRYGPEGLLSENDVQYRVSNNVSVKIRELDRVGEVLDAAIEAGANNIYGVEFLREEMDEVRSTARKEAVADAAFKAEELAAAAELALGPIVSLSEIIGNNGGYYAGALSAPQGVGGGGGTPISPGQLEIVYQIQAVYSIAE